MLKRIRVIFILLFVLTTACKNGESFTPVENDTGSPPVNDDDNNNSENENKSLCDFEEGLILTEELTLKEVCPFGGDVEISGQGKLMIDLSDVEEADLIFEGNISLKDNAQLIILGHPNKSNVTVHNEFYFEHQIDLYDDAKLELQNIKFKTQKGETPEGLSYSMNLNSYDQSSVKVENISVDTTRAWVLGYFKDDSSFSGLDTEQFPTETYLSHQTSVIIEGPTSETGLWLDLDGANQGEFTLPVQTGAPYTWELSDSEDFSTGWSVSVINAIPGIGVQSYPGSDVTINGHGVSLNNGDLSIGYHVQSQMTLSDLPVNIASGTWGGRLTLDNVDLGPIAWQIYVGPGGDAIIEDSVVNEIGLYGDGAKVTVNSTMLQLAVIALYAPNTSLVINDSLMWNQLVDLQYNATVEINNTAIYGSLFNSSTVDSVVTISDSVFGENPANCTPNTMVNVDTGEPLCNPYSQPGFPVKEGIGTVTCEATENCSF